MLTKHSLYCCIPFIVMMSFKIFPAEPLITVYMAGDSTMSIKHVKDYPETGWGMPFSYFFDSGVKVDNRAENGRSTKTFISEGRWQRINNELKSGDYVIIQFGHNDQSTRKGERYTPPKAFQDNLIRFINNVEAKLD